MRLTEIASDLVRPPLGAPEEAPDIARQLPEVPRPLAPHRVGLDILVEQFIGAERGVITNEVTALLTRLQTRGLVEM